MENENEIVLFEAKDGVISLPVRIDKDTVQKLWTMADDKYYQIILMLIYSGPRIGEFHGLLKSDVHLDEKYYVVKESKTPNGIRKVPIADKVFPFFEKADIKCFMHQGNNKPERLSVSF